MVDISHKIAIKAPLSKVFAALSTVEGVGAWWTTETTGECKPGGTIKVRFSHHDGTERGKMQIQVLKLDPDREVHWRFKAGPEEWLETDVTFNLSHAGEHTTVLFGHRNWREPVEFMAHCSMKWATFLLSLKELVETGKGKPAPDDLKIESQN